MGLPAEFPGEPSLRLLPSLTGRELVGVAELQSLDLVERSEEWAPVSEPVFFFGRLPQNIETLKNAMECF